MGCLHGGTPATGRGPSSFTHLNAEGLSKVMVCPLISATILPSSVRSPTALLPLYSTAAGPGRTCIAAGGENHGKVGWEGEGRANGLGLASSSTST